MARIIVTHGVPQSGLEMLDGHEVFYPGELKVFSQDELMQMAGNADAVIAGGLLDAAFIDAAVNLKIIANYGAGFDRVDVKAASAHKIPVTNTPDETSEPTAEIAIGLILATARRIAELDHRLRNEPTPTLFGMGKHMGMGLKGNTLGIVGMGRIGSFVAEFGKLMGMRVVYYNRHRAADEHGAEWVTLEELMRSSQIVSVHCPLNDSTRYLIGEKELSYMQERAILVNTARGPVVDYEALAHRLAEGQLLAAGLDVFDHEPEIPEILLELPNVVLTPHIGTNTREAREAMLRACCSRILEVLKGERPQHVVNPEIYE